MCSYRQPFRGEYPINQVFGEIVPGVTLNNKPHTGIDYLTPMGTEILASAEGQVMFAAWDRTGYGFCVIIQHTANRATLYAHLDQISVVQGQRVQQGDVIGKSGNSGYTTGPHLHFEARTQWNDIKSAFDPVQLPMMTIDDNAINAAKQSSEVIHTERKHPVIPAGVCKIACNYAFIRDWATLTRDRTLSKGERVYVFDDVKYDAAGLPFRFIGAGRCIAEYDGEGTQIIEVAE